MIKLLKKARENKGLSQTQLSRLTGIDQSYISKLELSPFYKHSPTIRQITKLSKELNICPICLTHWFLAFHMNCSHNCIDTKTIVMCNKLMLIHNS